MNKIKKILKNNKVKIIGKNGSFKPSYELVCKCKRSEGLLYILGDRKSIVPKAGNEIAGTSIRKYNNLYYNINLPERVSCAKVCCGISFVIILSYEGNVYAWGDSPSSALGKNRIHNYNTIKIVPGLTNNKHPIKDIACGNTHCLAINTIGILFSWGNGDCGKLGNGRIEDRPGPTQISVEKKEVNFIWAGHNSSFCKAEQKYYCWGDVSNNKFGRDSAVFYKVPTEKIYDFDINSVAISDSYSVMISDTGFLYQFGLDETYCINKKYKNLECVYFYNVAGNADRFIALSNDGSIYKWSLNESDGGSKEYNPDSKVPIEISSCEHQFPTKTEEDVIVENTLKDLSSKIVSVACAEQNTVAITDQGEVIITGTDALGEMGLGHRDIETDTQGERDQYSDFVLVPRFSIQNKTFISKVACGAHHMLGITKGGKVLSWGSNSSGQLGLGTFTPFERYPEIINSVDKENIIMAAASATHSMLLSEDGSVYTFGSALNGKLGLGLLKSTVLLNTPTKISNLANIRHISCGENNSLALAKDGKLFIWGNGWKGQLGNGKNENSYEPLLLLMSIDWIDAECGYEHIVGVSSTLKTYHWGNPCTDEVDELLYPTLVKGLEGIRVKKVYASNEYSVALVENGYSIYSWGKQRYKRLLGANSNLKEHCLNGIINFSIPGEKIQKLSINMYHGAILTNHDNLYTWGCPANGRTGGHRNMLNKASKFDLMLINLSKYLTNDKEADLEEEKEEELHNDIQTLLQNQPEDMTEDNIKKVDLKIINLFDECINTFVEISHTDKQNSLFFDRVEHKMITRLQQEPFRCGLAAGTRNLKTEIQEKIIGYGSLLTTYRVHSCFLYNLLKLNIRQEKKIEMINLIYTDIEKDSRLLYTGIYLSKKLLHTALNTEGIEFKSFLNDPCSELYRNLLYKIITSSEKDVENTKKTLETLIQNLEGVINDDPHGIDFNPLNTLKNSNLSNKITAYQTSRNLVDRRVNKLKIVMQYLVDNLRKVLKEDYFSDAVSLIVKDFTSQCIKKFNLQVSYLDYMNEMVVCLTHSVLAIVFEPLYKALENPLLLYVNVEDSTCSEFNLIALSRSVKSFFSGVRMGDQNERWLNTLNDFNTLNEKNLQIKVEILEKILEKKPDLEDLYLESLFLDSLSPCDKSVTVPGKSINTLHLLTANNIESLVISNPTFDPLVLITNHLKPVMPSKFFHKGENLNLALLTRSLRYDQSLVRCPECSMPVSRDMAPSNFKPIISIYNPLPPTSPAIILSNILISSNKRTKKVSLLKYLEDYEDYVRTYIKDFKVLVTLDHLNLYIETIAKSAIEVLPQDENEQAELIQKNKEFYLKKFEKECEINYHNKIQHRVEQRKIKKTFKKLLNSLKERSKNSNISADTQKKILFDVGYGGSNIELEKFSDPVMFSIYMNKIREYTRKKEISTILLENLNDEMQESLNGFMKRSLSELISKDIIKDFSIPDYMNPKDVVFSFEVSEKYFLIIVSYSKKKFNFCIKEQFRQEEILMYEKVLPGKILDLRNQLKNISQDAV